MAERISDAEHAVMEVLWEDAPLTAEKQEDKVEYFSGLWLETLISTSLIIIYTKESKAQRC